MAKSDAKTVSEYLDELPEERRAAIEQVRAAILDRLPAGYEETMQYGMISYVVPRETLPETYNGQPLALASIANQKNYMAVYLNNVYGDPSMEAWFTEAYRATGKKLDMGKSCVRFKRLDDLPVEIVAEAVARTPVDAYVEQYHASRSADQRGGK